jgi:hypothetical protein
MLRACIPFEELLLTEGCQRTAQLAHLLEAGRRPGMNLSHPMWPRSRLSHLPVTPHSCGWSLHPAASCSTLGLALCDLGPTSSSHVTLLPAARHTSPCCILSCVHLMNTPTQYVSNHLLPAAARCGLPHIFLLCHPAASCRALLSSFFSSATSAWDASSCDLSPATSCSLLASLRALQAVGQSRPGSRKVIKRLAHCAPLLPFSS